MAGARRGTHLTASLRSTTARPFARQGVAVRRLCTSSRVAFPTPAHLASWAKFAAGINASAGKTRGNGFTGHGNRYLARVLGEAAVGAGRTDTFLGARYRRITRRRGKKKAIVAVGRSLLVIIWHVLAGPDTRFHELGSDHYDRHVNITAKRRQHVRQLEALGYRVTLEPAA